MTLQEKLAAADKIVQETKIMFSLQDIYFKDRADDSLAKLRAQSQKLKGMINSYSPKR